MTRGTGCIYRLAGMTAAGLVLWVLFAVVVRGCASDGGEGHISQAQAEQVQPGMSREQVTALLGKPDLTSEQASQAAAKLAPGLALTPVPGGSSWTYRTREGGSLSLAFGPG